MASDPPPPLPQSPGPAPDPRSWLPPPGLDGAAANRRAFPLGQEPLDLFRRTVAFTAKAQAQCHFSPQLIDNLERFWQAAERGV